MIRHFPHKLQRLLGTLGPLGLITCMSFLLTASNQAQNVNFGASTLHDSNIFDTYAPTSDQITQLRTDASTGWDFNQAWLGLSYSGALLLYQSTSPRNYHAHTLSLGTIYHFENHDDDDAEDASSDSSNEDSDDSTQHRKEQAPTIVHADSLDHYFYGTVTGGSQFNKSDFREYDRSAIASTVMFRQPLGLFASLRPFYSFGYHYYPNLSSITNAENLFGLLVGVNPFQGTWIGISGAFGHKIYPSSNTFTYTFSDTNGGANGYGHGVGHGKGSGGGGTGTNGKTKTVTYNFTTPSVSQFSVSVAWHQTLSAETQFSIQLSHFADPSSQARIIPERIQSVVESRNGSLQDLTNEDIFDDRFSYTGNETALQIKQMLPFTLLFSLEGHVQGKTFTSPATSLAGDTLDAHRVDRRYEIVLNLSRPFMIAEGKTVSPQLEFHYLRNNSNEPFYDFDRNAILAGIEVEF